MMTFNWNARIHRALWLWAASLVLGAVAWPLTAQAEKKNWPHPEPYFQLDSRLVTPHIAWARPYTGKKLKVLVIAPRWMQRGTVELMERLDAECVPMLTYAPQANQGPSKPMQGMLWCKGDFWPHENDLGIKKDAVLKDLRDKLSQNWDVIVLCWASTQDFPPDAVALLKKNIENGTGLVYLHPADLQSECSKTLSAAATPPRKPLSLATDDQADAAARNWFAVGTPYALLNWAGYGYGNPAKNPDFIQLQELGKGRLVQCCWMGAPNGTLAPLASVDLEYEYLIAVTVKAILWAGKQTPEVQFSKFPELLDGHNPKANLNKLDFALQNNGATRTLKATLSIRSNMRFYRLPQTPVAKPGVQQTQEFIEPIFTQTHDIAVPAGDSAFNFDLPTLPATYNANYWVDVRLADDQGRAVNWAFTQIRPWSKGQVEPTLEFTPAALDVKAGTEATPRLTIKLAKAMSSDMTAQITLVDNRDRLLGRQTAIVPAGQQQVDITLPVALDQVRATLIVARVELGAQGKPVWIGLGELPVMHRAWPDFTFFAWSGVRDYASRQRFRQLAGMGVDGGRFRHAPQIADLRQCADFGVRIHGTADSKTQTLKPDLSSPEYRKEVTDKLAAEFIKGKRITQDSFAYLLGDDVAFCNGGLAGAPTSPSATAGLRSFLQGRYGDIAKLNAEWGTSFASFDQITPGKPLNDLSAQAKKAHNYAIWLDQWLYNDWLYVDTMRFLRQEIRKYNPTAELGMSTPLWNHYYAGFDWPAIMSVCQFATPYGPLGDNSSSDAMRAFLPQGGAFSYHFGSYLDQELTDLNHFRLLPYLTLFRGGSNVFWYVDWGDEGGFTPWLEPYPFLQATADTVREIKNGIGAMWLGGVEPHPIALHYSRHSQLFAATVGMPAPAFRGNTLTAAIREMGLQPWMVSSQQIEKDGLAGYKVLLMPVSQAVSAQEARAIEEFAKGGGVVIGYLRPGLADEHGKLNPAASLPKMFGVRWTDKLFTPADVIDKKTGTTKPGDPAQLRNLIAVDSLPLSGEYRGIKFSCPTDMGQVDDAVAVDDAQVLATAHGVPAITSRAVGKGVAICINVMDTEGKTIRSLLSAVFKAHGLESCVKLSTPVQGFEPGLWMPGLEVTRRIDDKAEYLGIVRVQPPYTRLPEQKVQVDLGGVKHVYDPRSGQYMGTRDKMELSLPGSATYLYAMLPYAVTGMQAQVDKAQYACGETIMEVVRPDGQTVPYLSSNVIATDGTARFTVPLCLNEPPGKWTLTFTDAATQIKRSVSVQVDGIAAQ